MNIEDVRDNKTLIEFINAGNKAKYLFFYGHYVPKDGSIQSSCFSQWYPAGFTIDGINYKTAEHFMMAEKARLFEDDDSLSKILASETPREAKALGRKVNNFVVEKWAESSFKIVVAGNHAKFSQNAKLKDFLLGTNDSVIVEASPKDRIWGIGISQKNPKVENPENWRGQNLLGYALMEARSLLSV